jgi:fructosamine-3-kinase
VPNGRVRIVAYAPDVDLGYLRAHPRHIATFLRHQRIRTTPVPGGDICTAERLTLDDGSDVFAKSHPAPPPGFFAAEVAGLRWLRAAGGAPVPEVLAATDDLLALEWVQPAEPTPAAAERFGRDLAATHRAGAPTFGAAPTLPSAGPTAPSAGQVGAGAGTATAGGGGPARRGFIGILPLDNTPGDDWAAWFAERRLRPYLRRSVDNGALTGTDAGRVEAVLDRIGDLAGPPEPPARTHGDLWLGNLLWGAGDRVWLVDPAAAGGHRETDLAVLGLFGGAPYLDRMLAAYREAWPLADGWPARVPLHQLHLLLVHTAMFGAAYTGAVLDAVARL